MFTQKLYKNGNSVAVTIPKMHLKELGLRDGSPVEVDIQNKDWVLRPKKNVKHFNKKTRGGVSEEFRKWLDGALREDAKILDELAER